MLCSRHAESKTTDAVVAPLHCLPARLHAGSEEDKGPCGVAPAVGGAAAPPCRMGSSASGENNLYLY